MIVVAGRGKIGGHVASANRSGAYFRTKVTPVNPQTSFQNEVRSRLGGLSQAWRGLTEAQRAGWNGAVGSYSKTDIFGDIRNPSGINLFQRLNNNLLTIGQSQIDDAPQPSEVFTSALGAFSIELTTPTYEIEFDTAVPADVNVKVFATPGLSPGKASVAAQFRLIDTPVGAAATSFDISAGYIAKFGVPPVGSKVFVKVVFVNNTTGQESTQQTLSTIVLA